MQEQLELRFDRPCRVTQPRAACRRGPQRFRVARWWFSRMRDAVRMARDWQPAQVPWGPAEQVPLPLAAGPRRWPEAA